MSLYKVRKAVISTAVSAMEFSGQTDPTTLVTYAMCSMLVFTSRFHTSAFQASIKPIIFAVTIQVWRFIKEPIKIGSVSSYINYFSSPRNLLKYVTTFDTQVQVQGRLFPSLLI